MKKHVYIVTNKINGKVYIGQTNNLKRRWQEHKHDKRGCKKQLHLAIEKHGVENFEIKSVYYGEDYVEKEKELIEKYDSMNSKKGYNIKPGGEDSAGELNPMAKITWKQAEKISKMLKKTTKTTTEIALINGTTKKTVGNINVGAAWKNDELYTYPIREDYTKKNKKISLEVIESLKNNSLTMEEIQKKYNLNRWTVLSINSGKSFKQNDEKYPIRTFKIKEEIIKEVIKLLKETEKSMNQISKELKITKDTIYRINKGESYFKLENEEYPIRKVIAINDRN